MHVFLSSVEALHSPSSHNLKLLVLVVFQCLRKWMIVLWKNYLLSYSLTVEGFHAPSTLVTMKCQFHWFLKRETMEVKELYGYVTAWLYLQKV